MKILLITAYFPPEVGSAAHLYHDLGVALTQFGHEVTVLTALPGYNAQGDLKKYRRKLWMQEEVDGLRVIRVATPRLPRRLMFGRALWQFGSALSMAAASAIIGRHDAAIVYSPPLPLGLSAWMLRALKNTPFILNVQDLFPQSVIDLGLLKNKLLIRFFEGLEKFLYSRADLISVHSDTNAAHVICNGDPPPMIEVMPNWVDTDEICPNGSGEAFRKRYGLSDEFVVSFGGVIAYSQDIDVILDAAGLLRDRTDIRWLIAGDGVEKERLVSLAQERSLENVRFLPMLPREEYPELLYASDACLATLRAEVKTPVVPSKIMSIMAAGKPVIACMDECGDAPKLIHKAECGYALPPGDAKSLADTVVKLYEDNEAARKLGANGRDYAERHLSLKQAASNYLQIISSMTRKHASSVQETQ
jgi:glycosyltransferase involved in cell wall biosynthesis